MRGVECPMFRPMTPGFGDLCDLTLRSTALHFQVSVVSENLGLQAFRWGSREAIVEARSYLLDPDLRGFW